MARSFKKNGAFPKLNKRRVFNEGNGLCGICTHPVKFGQMTIDHIIPLSRGGANEYHNAQPAHSLCNHLKGNLLPDEITPKLLQEIGHRAKERYVNRPGRLGKRKNVCRPAHAI